MGYTLLLDKKKIEEVDAAATVMNTLMGTA